MNHILFKPTIASAISGITKALSQLEAGTEAKGVTLAKLFDQIGVAETKVEEARTRRAEATSIAKRFKDLVEV